ncbi:PilZ domain-containing protein [Massilia sp. IC2-278]|uniref:PilZ domain-containing protein n=1 Tax=Massilia sp. IC2-278 TaxID=2887200 RepID=UPI001E5F52C0|nr:PilZ domain-containing protein [Massilia sp. IC2-278]MCC2960670.1 PilZ domain-containing protein [Massilia sp. IC2-278]
MTDSFPAALERIERKSAHEMCDAFDIGEALAALAAAGATLTVYPPGAAASTAQLPARIVAVDAAAPRFTLELPGAPLIAAGRATFVALLAEDVPLQFDLDSDWRVSSAEPYRISLPFPETCLVLDRRATPRADTALVDYFAATVTLPDRQIELPLCDFATGGIGMHAPPDAARRLHVGQKLKNVRLQLGPALAIVADLEVRMLRPFRSYLLGEQVQVGCRYDRIGMEMRRG